MVNFNKKCVICVKPAWAHPQLSTELNSNVISNTRSIIPLRNLREPCTNAANYIQFLLSKSQSEVFTHVSHLVL